MDALRELPNSNENPEQERRGLQTLISTRVDGALIACCDNTTATYDLVLRRTVPAAFLDRIPLAVNAIRISTDNFKAGWGGTKHLIDLGHKRIAIVAGCTELSAYRIEGFREAMQEAGLLSVTIISERVPCRPNAVIRSKSRYWGLRGVRQPFSVQ
jgi:LacI family transcriptional regulator